MFDLFFGIVFFFLSNSSDIRSNKRGKKGDEKFLIEKLSRGPIWRQKNGIFFFFHARKFSRLATYYVTYIRASNDTHH